MRTSTIARFAIALAAGGFPASCGSPSPPLPIEPASSAASAGSIVKPNRTAPLYQVLHVFRNVRLGENPLAPVIADSAGNLYGETFQGARRSRLGGCGTVFKLTLSGKTYVESTLHRFQNKPDGCEPEGGLTMDSTGAIYGATEFGGKEGLDGEGTIFKLAPAGTGYSYSVIYKFTGGADGAWPLGGLLIDASGVIYGATQSGAASACPGAFQGCGTVYTLSPAKSGYYTEKTLHAFQGGSDGVIPSAGLAMDSKGAIYGTTSLGGYGSIGNGTVYKLTPTRSGYSEQVIHAFSGSGDGNDPQASVVVERNGTLVGTTLYGGSIQLGGTVFALKPRGSKYSENILYNFTGNGQGSEPAAPVLDVSGVLYGTTSDGGVNPPCGNQCGTIFELKPTRSGYAHSVLYHMTGPGGWFPHAGVILYNGALYGTTYESGRSFGGGVVYKLTP